jgi:hypothetical protein
MAYRADKDRKGSESFGVPAQTLRDRTKGAIDPYSCRTGPKTPLSEKEDTLVEHVEVMPQLGYEFSNRQFQHLAGELMQINNKHLNNNWLYAFFGNWSYRLASLPPKKSETPRANSATPEAVDKYLYQSLAGLSQAYLRLIYRIISSLSLAEVALKRNPFYLYLMVMHHMSHSH